MTQAIQILRHEQGLLEIKVIVANLNDKGGVPEVREELKMAGLSKDRDCRYVYPRFLVFSSRSNSKPWF